MVRYILRPVDFDLDSQLLWIIDLNSVNELIVVFKEGHSVQVKGVDKAEG